MKNIIIIEDNFNHFQIIKKLITDNEIDTYPKNINSGQDLCDFLTPVKAFIDTTDVITRVKRINEFLDDVNLKQNSRNIHKSLYIVDYQLLADNNYINGLKFCEYINDIREGKVPAIILTIIDLNTVDVNHQKNEFINKYPKSKIEFYRKVQDKRNKKIRNWDENGKNIDDIVSNSIELSSSLKSTINRLCQLVSEEELHPTILKIDAILNIESYISSVNSEIIQELTTQLNLLKNKLIENKALSDDNKLIAILDKFIAPHDTNKIKMLIANITQFLLL